MEGNHHSQLTFDQESPSRLGPAPDFVTHQSLHPDSNLDLKAVQEGHDSQKMLNVANTITRITSSRVSNDQIMSGTADSGNITGQHANLAQPAHMQRYPIYMKRLTMDTQDGSIRSIQLASKDMGSTGVASPMRRSKNQISGMPVPHNANYGFTKPIQVRVGINQLTKAKMMERRSPSSQHR